MLKQVEIALRNHDIPAAAFGRLCVETAFLFALSAAVLAAAFGRLCVETTLQEDVQTAIRAAAFGRLCVETVNPRLDYNHKASSRLRAAVC